MAEEQHRCQAQEGHRLCANNCGFFGSPATMNFCSKCFRDLRLKEEQASSAKIAVEKSLSGPSSSSSSSSSTQTLITTTNIALSPPAIALPATAASQRSPVSVNLNTAAPPPSDLQAPPVASQSNRCSTCRKRVGLTGFRCRCGITFCSTHRYPEQHGCTFDFKGVGREAIAKANPVVKAQKLDKI